MISCAMIGENRQLVTYELIEVQYCRKITDHLRGIYRIYPTFIKEDRRVPTCNRLDLLTLGSQPTMPKNLLYHWSCEWLICVLIDKWYCLFLRTYISLTIHIWERILNLWTIHFVSATSPCPLLHARHTWHGHLITAIGCASLCSHLSQHPHSLRIQQLQLHTGIARVHLS